MPKWYQPRAWSIRRGILSSYFILIVVICCVICTSLLLFSKSIILDGIGQSRVDVLKQIAERAQAVKNSMITLSNLYSYDPAVAQTLSIVPELLPESSPVLADKIKTLSVKYIDAYKDINLFPYVFLQGENGFDFCSDETYSYHGKTVKAELWYKNVVHNKGQIFWVSSYKDDKNPEKEKYVFSAARTIHNAQGNVLGLLLVNIDERQLFETYSKSLNGSNTIFIVDEKGTIVSHQNQNMLGLNYYDMDRFAKMFKRDGFSLIKKGDEQYLLSNAYDEMTGWTIVEEIPVHVLLSPMQKLTYTTVGIALISLLVSFLLSYWVAYRTADPINRLCQKMQTVRQGNLKVTSEVTGWREIRNLNEVFNQMMAETSRLMENIKLEERLKRIAELDFLQSQINPHFLYNTLFSIKCMISMGKNEEAEKMMELFIKLMKTAISSSNELIPIHEEILWIAQFLELIQYRYSEPIEVSYKIPEELQNYQIPRMLLQPIVENSIYHGIESNGGGCITIEAVEHGNEIWITVSDDGAGMTPEKLEKIVEGKWKKNSYNKVGLANVRERIQMSFGANYGLSIVSAPGKGTSVTTRIPQIE